MNYLTAKKLAAKWAISDRRVLQYCNENRIDGARKIENTWLIPRPQKSQVTGGIRESKRGIGIWQIF